MVLLWPVERWKLRAACRGADLGLFFDVNNPKSHQLAQIVANYCDRCPVRAQCADAGRDQPYGVWGGLTAKQRGWKADLTRAR